MGGRGQWRCTGCRWRCPVTGALGQQTFFSSRVIAGLASLEHADKDVQTADRVLGAGCARGDGSQRALRWVWARGRMAGVEHVRGSRKRRGGRVEAGEVEITLGVCGEMPGPVRSTRSSFVFARHANDTRRASLLCLQPPPAVYGRKLPVCCRCDQKPTVPWASTCHLGSVGASRPAARNKPEAR